MRDTLITATPYEYNVQINSNPVLTCPKNFTHTQVQQFSSMIQHGYRYSLYLDDLPSVTLIRDPRVKNEGESSLRHDYQEGIPIGEYNKATK